VTVDVVIDAEIAEPYDEERAQRLDMRVRLQFGTIDRLLAKFYETVEEAKRGQIHVALGFASWTAYLADVLGGQLQVKGEARKEVVSWLSREGMSQRAIAKATGVGVGTVNRDLAESPVPDGTPDTDGMDGKRYKRRPPPEPVFADDQEAADCFAMADLADDEFETVLADSRAQGDLSREHVAQLCREHAAESTPTTGLDEDDYYDDDYYGAIPAGHGNSKMQIKTLENLQFQLRTTADCFVAMFAAGAFEKTCTPDIAHGAAEQIRAAIARINTVLPVLEGHQ
jgi:hypothetical protein